MVTESGMDLKTCYHYAKFASSVQENPNVKVAHTRTDADVYTRIQLQYPHRLAAGGVGVLVNQNQVTV